MTTKVMRLSEAIRLGSMASTKCEGEMEDANGSRCALGAALFAVGEKIDQFGWEGLWRQWPWIRLTVAKCPGCGISTSVTNIVWHLNDSHHWSREQIADWVQTQEDQMDLDSAHERVMDRMAQESTLNVLQSAIQVNNAALAALKGDQ